MPQSDEVVRLFENTGAYLQGHFRLTSGLHSDRYLQCALVLKHPDHAEQLGRDLAEKLSALTPEQPIGLVMSPALGGLIIGHEVARALGTPFLFTERGPDGKMALRRGFSLDPETRVAVVEDVVTTGGSTREVIELVRAAGGKPVAAGCIMDRSGGAAELSGVPKVALATLQVQTFSPETCPQCLQGIPVVKPGSRATDGSASPSSAAN
jgi:orotate phosphoribosyltransferase